MHCDKSLQPLVLGLAHGHLGAALGLDARALAFCTPAVCRRVIGAGVYQQRDEMAGYQLWRAP